MILSTKLQSLYPSGDRMGIIYGFTQWLDVLDVLLYYDIFVGSSFRGFLQKGTWRCTE